MVRAIVKLPVLASLSCRVPVVVPGTSWAAVTVTAAQLVPGTTTGTLQLKDANTGSFTIALTIQ